MLIGISHDTFFQRYGCRLRESASACANVVWLAWQGRGFLSILSDADKAACVYTEVALGIYLIWIARS